MNIRHQKIFSAVALFLILAVSHVCVQAAVVASPALNDGKGATMLVPSGKLAARNLIKLNGNDVASGTTILSGARIETPADSSATVQLGTLGSVELAPATSLTLNFGNSNVDIKLAKGFVVLTTMKGVDGAMTTPNGVVSKNDSSKVSTLIGKDESYNEPAAQGNSGGGGGTGLFGLSNAAARTFGLVVLGIAIAIAVIETHRHGRGINPSPGVNR